MPILFYLLFTRLKKIRISAMRIYEINLQGVAPFHKVSNKEK